MSLGVFLDNEADHSGSALYIRISSDFRLTMNISGSVFSVNNAKSGGAIVVYSVNVMISKSEFWRNVAETGVVFTYDSSVVFSGNVTFFNNIGSLVLFSSTCIVTETGNITIMNNSSPAWKSKGKVSLQQGGAITAFQSSIVFRGPCTLVENHAQYGAAVHAVDSNVYVYGDTLVANNRALDSGGGVYLYQSELNFMRQSTFEIISNKAIEKGGGIYAISSLIRIDYREGQFYSNSVVNLIENNAKLGGGLFLESAKVYILKRYVSSEDVYVLLFTANSAEYGGAVYVADDANSAMCASTSYTVYSERTECCMQTLALHNELQTELVLGNINNTNNYAYISGSTLFGGLLDRCTINPFAEVYYKYNPETEHRPDVTDGATYFKLISSINEFSTISSHPVRVYFCGGSQRNYKLQVLNIQVKKGETFTVSVVAVDQVNHTVNATIHSSLSSNFGGLGENQLSQNTNEFCTDLSFSVFSPRESEELILYENGPCKNAEISLGRINIQFLSCTCPIGVQQNTNETTNCICECDSKLRHYITECHQHNRTLVREGNFWITYVNSTTNSSDYNYLIYRHCPLDYCFPSTTKVYIDL